MNFGLCFQRWNSRNSYISYFHHSTLIVDHHHSTNIRVSLCIWQTKRKPIHQMPSRWQREVVILNKESNVMWYRWPNNRTNHMRLMFNEWQLCNGFNSLGRKWMKSMTINVIQVHFIDYQNTWHIHYTIYDAIVPYNVNACNAKRVFANQQCIGLTIFHFVHQLLIIHQQILLLVICQSVCVPFVDYVIACLCVLCSKRNRGRGGEPVKVGR